MADRNPLPRSFYLRHPAVVAPELLNKVLVRADGRAGRIVEVEAYAGSEDPAAHSHRGPTLRNASMFGPGGHLYVYLNYGIHWCANAVCGEVGEGHGILLRAIEPVAGVDLMRQARGGPAKERDIGSGPGRLGQAMGITRALDGADLVTGDAGLWIVCDGVLPPANPVVGPRVGISRAVDLPWRWSVPANAHVSKGRPRPGAVPRRSPR
ncbi:DNA-3-methyladenine glycosylase [Luteimonas viscosa]|uniref:Putative 3-methyladenine DNA glycosylase n=1 Tax=Luteimonas viscosa TaxID=1132694 RepID=A0A5D4XGV7_9GAMM|nr:DNA-3-methyladenine glycosylase [Luteimonas viscosa]TYT23858.1 DNA-3-methyladenine glycosylase [Luteimonas viscosa]